MASMNISLPEAMKDWVEEQARSGLYANASDYVRALIRADQQRAARLAEFDRLVQAGIDSPRVAMTREQLLARLRAKAAEAVKDKKSA